jgi:Pyruvate/2-oxoacid:ferredoxin oxidoreductase delta subunit
MTETRHCPHCQTHHPVAEFYTSKNSRYKSGLRYQCKKHSKELSERWHEVNKEKALTVNTKWAKANPDKIKVIRRRYTAKTKFGMTLTEIDTLEKKHNSNCHICKKSSDRSLDIDHDHTTNKVRGLLCRTCNLILGLCKENKETLRSAIDYLTEHS